MSLLARIFLVLLIVPFIELYLLLQIGDYVGFWPTIGGIVAMAAAGSFLLRHQGFAAWRKFSNRLATGVLPGPELVDTLIIAASGILMITPGVLTDVVGITGLIPPIRKVYRDLILKKVGIHLVSGDGIRGGFFRGNPFSTGSNQPAEDPSGWSGTGEQTPSYRRENPDIDSV